MRLVYSFVAAALMFLTACDQQAWFDKFVPKEEVESAKRLLESFGSRDFAAIERQLDPSLVSPELRPKLQQVADQFPSGQQPISVQVVGAHTNKTRDRTTYNLTFQYEYPDKWLLANVVLLRENGQLRVAGVHVNPLADSLQNLNRFTFSQKSLLHWVVFVLAVAIPVFIAYVFVLCVRTPVPRRKWLWLLFISVGLVQFSINWTTGAWNLTPLSFLLLGAGFTQAGPAAPYILTVALPVGAVLFLRKRRLWVVPSAA